MSRLARPLGLLLCISVALLTEGCTPLPEIELFSHAAARMVLMPADQESCELVPGGRCVFKFAMRVRMKVRNADYEYHLPANLRTEMSEEWVEFRPVSRHILKMQIEDDGLIYILPATASGSVAAPGRQREGFPLRPRTRDE